MDLVIALWLLGAVFLVVSWFSWKVRLGSVIEPITLTEADSFFIETRKFTTEEIARLFGIPRHLLDEVEAQTFCDYLNEEVTED